MEGVNPGKTPEAKCVLEYILRRIKKRLGCNILMTGELGKGKSYDGIRLMELWYKSFFNESFPISHVVETLEEAILLTKDFNRKGEGVLIEEISVLAGARESLTRMNRLFNKFMDTVRIKQIVLIMNCPHIRFVDKHIIMLSNIWIDCLGVNFTKKIGIAKPLMLQFSQHKPEPYRHKFVNDDGDVIDLIYFNKPSKELCDAYDQRKLEATARLYEEIAMKMNLEKQKQLKELGQKMLPPRELEAYQLKLEGYNSKQGAEKMGLKDYHHYNAFLRRAKARLKDAKYQHFAIEMGFIGRIKPKNGGIS